MPRVQDAFIWLNDTIIFAGKKYGLRFLTLQEMNFSNVSILWGHFNNNQSAITCSKLTTETLEQGFFIFNFEHISHQVFNFEQVTAGWVRIHSGVCSVFNEDFKQVYYLQVYREKGSKIRMVAVSLRRKLKSFPLPLCRKATSHLPLCESKTNLITKKNISAPKLLLL